MCKNRIQFQQGLSLQSFLSQFGSKINVVTPWFVGGGRRDLFAHHVVTQSIAISEKGPPIAIDQRSERIFQRSDQSVGATASDSEEKCGDRRP